MKILFVEDDKYIAQMVQKGLGAFGYTVETAEDGQEGGFLARSYDYDLVILDNSLPKKSGLTICKEIRASGRSTPIIFLSINTDTDTKVAALEAGADDYMTKPFSMSELHARIKAMLRRPKELRKDNNIKVGKLVLDTNKQTTTLDNKDVPLTRKEFGVLEDLVRNVDTIMSRSSIMEHVWTADSDPFSNTVEAHIRNIRKKLNSVNEKEIIINMPGRGYIINS